MEKLKLIFLSMLCVLIFMLTSCTKQDQFFWLDYYNCSVYQYGTKDKYFAKYKDYHTFTDLNEIEYKEFTIFILNEKTDEMSEDLYDALLEQFKEPTKIIFIKGNSDKIKYEELSCRYNWNLLGEIGSEINFFRLAVNLNESKVSNDEMFFLYALTYSETIVQEYMKML